MDTEDSVALRCPHCGSGTEVVHASEGVDVALPSYEHWSILLLIAGVMVLASAFATGGAPQDNSGGDAVGNVLLIAAAVVGIVGAVRTRRNAKRLRSGEGLVRRYHQLALYCSACEYVHFPAADLPPGLGSGAAWPVREYRRRLWHACAGA